ncbi:MAG TPA: succinyl-CoA--3-ketoacid-CoA transferase, partial [Cryomorphaceae bacterium]|nr:succinyl-CoA--3-ketoacid-CoA transferase [Cryomorphaceae bacterium]
IIVAMMHTNRAGESKLLKKCTLPLTGVACVKKVVTDLAVMDIRDDAFVLRELAPGVSVDDVKNATEGNLLVEGDIPVMEL